MLHNHKAPPRTTQLSDKEVMYHVTSLLKSADVFENGPVRKFEQGTKEFEEVARLYR